MQLTDDHKQEIVSALFEYDPKFYEDYQTKGNEATFTVVNSLEGMELCIRCEEITGQMIRDEDWDTLELAEPMVIGQLFERLATFEAPTTPTVG
jgi:hypothetical protein